MPQDADFEEEQPRRQPASISREPLVVLMIGGLVAAWLLARPVSEPLPGAVWLGLAIVTAATMWYARTDGDR